MAEFATPAPRSWWRALRRGFARRCPACGEGAAFSRYLKVNAHCPHCGEVLHHQRADDAPPYFTCLIVGHAVVPLALTVEQVWEPPLAWQLGFWFPATLGLTLWLLPMVKGALVAVQWAGRMHGFGGHDD
jgi:uncharacterized protein (DUF983 family)